jgi:hypothetical protein
MNSLQLLDLSFNNLTTLTDDPTQSFDFTAFLGLALPSSNLIQYVNLEGNQLTGIMVDGWLEEYVALNTLILAQNAISSVEQLHGLYGLPVLLLDLSNNALQGPIPDTGTPSKRVTLYDFSGNPDMSGALPRWAVPLASYDKASALSPYSCPQFASVANARTELRVDPAYYSYSLCKCDVSYFGVAPNCFHIPVQMTLSAAQPQPPADGTAGDATGVASVLQHFVNGSVTDAWFGSQRMVFGVTTRWQFSGTANGAAPTRVVVLQIHINLNDFTADTDTIRISGDDPSSPPASPATPPQMDVWSISGTDPALVAARASSASRQRSSWLPSADSLALMGVDAASYSSRYASYFSALNASAVFTVYVVGWRAALDFSSRAQAGFQFFAVPGYATVCPLGYYLAAGVGGAAGACALNIPVYQISTSAVAVGQAFAGVCCAVTLSFLLVCIAYRHSIVIRSSSRVFSFLILLLLLAMESTSVLYTLVPSDPSADDWICNARGWATGLTFVGMISILLAKTNRVNRIFNTAKLQPLLITDGQLLRTIAIALAAECALLAAFSGAKLMTAQQTLGSGSGVHGQLVASCVQNSGFLLWLGFQLAFCGVGLAFAVYLAVRTWELPSAFNDSKLIGMAVIVIVFFLIIIVPVLFLNEDNPESAMVIQSVGQALLALILTLLLFASKMVYIASGRANDRDLTVARTKLTQAQTIATSAVAAGQQASALVAPIPRTPQQAVSSSIRSRNNAPAPAASGPALQAKPSGGTESGRKLRLDPLPGAPPAQPALRSMPSNEAPLVLPAASDNSAAPNALPGTVTSQIQ